MKDLLLPSTQQQQTAGTAPAQISLSSTMASGISTITPNGVHPRGTADDLVEPMNRTKLNTDESEKKRKTEDRMNLDDENVHPKLPPHGGSQQ